ncbi:MAG: hypothetical protein HOI80_04770 [Alphaproteobacteria bacterium]|nr:hypothetical protein [Alphaproteobacteria bacterium]MBT5389946.1 hypothetical protein [Alphaproteobacteria bacterium]MBT5540038.1 hypothetical protein [Alphaproteobacteria bacterium]MBT5654792.1 hypothetical protein [Alphaproteobacteria bacterium]
MSTSITFISEAYLPTFCSEACVTVLIALMLTNVHTISEDKLWTKTTKQDKAHTHY